jgi:DnaK suppressor protein
MPQAKIRNSAVDGSAESATRADVARPPPIPKRPPIEQESSIEVVADELTEEQRRELEEKLRVRRSALVHSIEERRAVERDTGREVGDEMDEASLEGDVGMTSKLLERDVFLLTEIDRSLAKFHAGTYGLCEGTGEPIGYERLRLQPWARYSIGYQEELEHKARARGV